MAVRVHTYEVPHVLVRRHRDRIRESRAPQLTPRGPVTMCTEWLHQWHPCLSKVSRSHPYFVGEVATAAELRHCSTARVLP
eukprot:8129767-Pyramimonas_sp.AAC.1